MVTTTAKTKLHARWVLSVVSGGVVGGGTGGLIGADAPAEGCGWGVCWHVAADQNVGAFNSSTGTAQCRDFWLLCVCNCNSYTVLSHAYMCTSHLQVLSCCLFSANGHLYCSSQKFCFVAGSVIFQTSMEWECLCECCRIGTVEAAAHAICFQVWLASSLLVDSLAVAAQALIGQNASINPAQALVVAQRSLTWALRLGCTLAAGLLVSRTYIPHIFSAETPMYGLAVQVLWWVALLQPVNALAFVWDGILFGVNGFKYVRILACHVAGLSLRVISG